MKRRALYCLATVLLFGCGAERKRRTFDVSVTGLLPTTANSKGWTVQLTSATLNIGPIRFFSGKVLLTDRSWHERLESLWGGTAYAHPGHYVAGEALAELLDTQTVSLLESHPVILGTASAVTGEYGSVQLRLPEEGTHSVSIKGVATAEGKPTVSFEGSVNLGAPIEGVRFERTMGEENGHVQIQVRLGRWLDRIDFATASPASSQGVSTFAADSQAQNALTRGVEDTTAYEVKWLGE